MSIQVINAVWQHSKSTGRARTVLLAIADHQGELGAWPSLATLARMVNASERSVQRDIDYLVAIGELEVHYQQAPTRNHYKSNLYWVKLPEVTKTERGATNTEAGVTNTEGGVTNTGGGVTAGVVQSLIEPLKETLSNTHVSELFDEFWKEYPRKSDKRAALRAFKSALARVSYEDIMAGVIRYAKDPNLPEMRFIKHPATWLNADAWENGPLPERKGKKTTDWEALKRWAEENEEN